MSSITSGAVPLPRDHNPAASATAPCSPPSYTYDPSLASFNKELAADEASSSTSGSFHRK